MGKVAKRAQRITKKKDKGAFEDKWEKVLCFYMYTMRLIKR